MQYRSVQIPLEKGPNDPVSQYVLIFIFVSKF